MSIQTTGFVSHQYTPPASGVTGIFQGYESLTGDASGGLLQIIMSAKAPATRLYRLDGATVATNGNTAGADFLLPNWIQQGGPKAFDTFDVDDVAVPVKLYTPWWWKSGGEDSTMCEFRVGTNPNTITCALHVFGVFFDDERYEYTAMPKPIGVLNPSWIFGDRKSGG